jgi:hypothetical protein
MIAERRRVQWPKVDRHDAGSGEMNIFIQTDDPIAAAFNEAKAALVVAIFGSMRGLSRTLEE